MNRFWTPLASLHLTWWTFLALAAWFWLGMAAEGLSDFARGLKELNEQLVRSWLAGAAWHNPLVLIWFLILVLLAALLALNLMACLLQRWNAARPAKSLLRFWIFWSLHVCVGLLMLLHALDMCLGSKHLPVSLQLGQTIDLTPDWSLRLDDLHLALKKDLLHLTGEQARHALTRERFDLKKNWARVSLFRKARLLDTETITMLQPLRHGSTLVVLRGFKDSSQGLGVRLRLVQAPLHLPFFLVYALLLVHLAAWVLLRIRQEPKSF